MNSPDPARSLAHDARQALNAIRLTTGNLRLRLGAALDGEHAAYLAAKLEKIDRQVDRLDALLDPPVVRPDAGGAEPVQS